MESTFGGTEVFAHRSAFVVAAGFRRAKFLVLLASDDTWIVRK